MIPFEQVLNGTIIFLETEVLPAYTDWRLWVAGGAIAIAKKKANLLLPALTQTEIIKSMGLIDDEGNIDLDTLAYGLKESIKKHGKFEVNFPGELTCHFKESDVDTLVSRIEDAGPKK